MTHEKAGGNCPDRQSDKETGGPGSQEDGESRTRRQNEQRVKKAGNPEIPREGEAANLFAKPRMFGNCGKENDEIDEGHGSAVDITVAALLCDEPNGRINQGDICRADEGDEQ